MSVDIGTMSLTRKHQKQKQKQKQKHKRTTNQTRKRKIQIDSGSVTSHHPGENFYLAVNKSWMDKTKIPPTRVAFGVSEEIEQRIETNSKQLLERCIRQAKSKDTHGSYKKSLETLLGNLVLSVQETNTTQANLELVQTVLSSINSLTNKEEVAVICGEFCKYKIHGLFHMYAQYENKNNSEYTYSIGTGSLGLPDSSYYFEKSLNRQKYLHAYKVFLKRLGKLFDIPNLHCSVKLERMLAGVLMESQNDTLEVQKTGAELEKEFRHIPWAILFETMGFSVWKSKLFFIDSIRWLHTLNHLFQELGLDQWKLLLTLEFVLYSLTWLPPKYSDVSFRFYRKYLRGQQKKLDRSTQAIYVAQQYATPFFSRLYKEEFIDTSIKPKIQHMIKEFQSVAKERLHRVEWLEEKTRKKAQEKVNAMGFIVAFPDSFEHHVLPQIDSKNLLANLLELGAWQTHYEIQKLGQPISQRKEWDDALFAVNAYYYEQANEMVIPSGILNPPFYDMEKSLAWNYGGIGCILAHEMTHAFDKEGKEFNEDGIQQKWWTSNDNRKYNEQTKALINLYDKQRIFGLPVSGTKTLSENIADIGGMSIALDALNQKLDTLRISEEERKEHYRQFFISYAISWRVKEKKKKRIQALILDKHAPPSLRVNLVISQFKEWYHAFDIKETDRLYIPPEKRIHIF